MSLQDGAALADKQPTGISRLEALVAKAEAASKARSLSIDWSMPVRLPPATTRSLVLKGIGHFYHGEQVAADFCALLSRRISHPVARTFLEIQMDDEARHAEMYRSYLQRLEGTPPQSRTLAIAAEKVRGWRRSPEAIVLACHMLLETESLRFGRLLDSWHGCSLFRAISAEVAQDEALHVAFGKFYLEECLPELPAQERREIYSWLKQLWMEAAGSTIRALTSIHLPHNVQQAFLESHWKKRHEWLASFGLVAAKADMSAK